MQATTGRTALPEPAAGCKLLALRSRLRHRPTILSTLGDVVISAVVAEVVAGVPRTECVVGMFITNV